MKQYYILYRKSGLNVIDPGFKVLYANSVEDAIKRSDLHYKLIYDVWLLSEWIEHTEKRFKRNLRT